MKDIAELYQSTTLLEGYHQAVSLFGRPLRLRADMCLEVLPIGQDMLDHRGAGAFIAGPSTANQRIENFWNYMWSHWARFYKQLFQDMERAGTLDRFNPAHLHSLKVAFLHELHTRALEVCNDWNFHPVRPQASRGIRSYVPARRFNLERINGASGEELRSAHVHLPAGSDISDGSWHSSANDTSEQAQHGPLVRDALLGLPEAPLRTAAFRSLAHDSDSVRNYLLHRGHTRGGRAAAVCPGRWRLQLGTFPGRSLGSRLCAAACTAGPLQRLPGAGFTSLTRGRTSWQGRG
ncbi:hypothetical protein WJX72_003361 [[Myrmecia] bisecta]|uniref:Integrase core domain-containing protein n=1 Tax=[Myrmecia] bisecta TaxID=41462 RepID=A0AAW1PHK1_9CHLO